jgi:hypothetical protein
MLRWAAQRFRVLSLVALWLARLLLWRRTSLSAKWLGMRLSVAQQARLVSASVR